MKPTIPVISCEHASNNVPSNYHNLFQHHTSILHTPQASDLGALEISQFISKFIGCELTQTNVSRLLIDCNRSLLHSRCFSRFSKRLPDIEKNQLIENYYAPFRQQTKKIIDSHISNNEQVLHISIHTFAPIIKGFTQKTGVGLLYDSSRHGEKEVARIWHGLLLQEPLEYLIRMNYPFRGNSDSFTKSLRRNYLERDYIGMEIEVNQALLTTSESINELARTLAHSLSELMQLL